MIKPFSKIIWRTLAVLAISLLAYLLFKGEKRSTEHLTIADASQVGFALLYVAEAKGYFKEEGLEVTYQKFSIGRDALKSVIDGKADVATVFETPLVLQVLTGKSVRVLSTLHRSSGNTSIIARRDRGINKLADLRGKRIGVTENTNADYLLHSILDYEAIPLDSVDIKHLAPNDNAQALINGDVDALATWSPHLGKARDGLPSGSTIIMSSPLYTEISMLATLDATVETKKEALRRLIRSIVRAEEYLVHNNDEALNLTLVRLAEQPASGVREVWRNIEFQARLDNLLLEGLNSEATWFTKQGKTVGSAPPFRNFIADELLDGIRPQSVTLRTVDSSEK